MGFNDNISIYAVGETGTAEATENTLESHSLTSPYDVTDTCAKFTIVDVDTPFVLHNITSENNEYVFSFWIKSDNDGEVRVSDTMIAANAKWERYIIYFTASSTDFSINFTQTGTYYVYHPKLEVGNKATDWTPAPEDTDAAINDVAIRVIEAETQIETNKEQISLRATKTEVEEALESYRAESQAELAVMADRVEVSVTKTVRQEITEGDDNLLALYNELRMNYDFTADGQYIGKKDSDTMLRLVNDMMQILVANTAVTTVDRSGLTASQVNISRLHMGDFTFSVSSDGNTLTLT